jgi:hypothetical protein
MLVVRIKHSVEEGSQCSKNYLTLYRIQKLIIIITTNVQRERRQKHKTEKKTNKYYQQHLIDLNYSISLSLSHFDFVSGTYSGWSLSILLVEFVAHNRRQQRRFVHTLFFFQLNSCVNSQT